MDQDIEQAGDKAAGVTVPAEAVEAAKQALRNWHDIPAPPSGIVERILAAAAPLIVADRDATLEWTRNLLADAVEVRDRLRVSFAKVAAERDAAVEATKQGIAAAIEDHARNADEVLERGAYLYACEIAAGIALRWTP